MDEIEMLNHSDPGNLKRVPVTLFNRYGRNLA